jgi:hypothetical protein
VQAGDQGFAVRDVGGQAPAHVLLDLDYWALVPK